MKSGCIGIIDLVYLEVQALKILIDSRTEFAQFIFVLDLGDTNFLEESGIVNMIRLWSEDKSLML